MVSCPLIEKKEKKKERKERKRSTTHIGTTEDRGRGNVKGEIPRFSPDVGVGDLELVSLVIDHGEGITGLEPDLESSIMLNSELILAKDHLWHGQSKLL